MTAAKAGFIPEQVGPLKYLMRDDARSAGHKLDHTKERLSVKPCFCDKADNSVCDNMYCYSIGATKSSLQGRNIFVPISNYCRVCCV